MSYPTLEQYTYAMQHPKLALVDPELKAGTIAKTGLGLPLALCGGFALTYTVTSGGKKYAVRCFHKQSNHLETRYKEISNRLKALRSSYFVDFEFQPVGVTVDRQKYPVVKMTWASGKTLGEFMAGNYHKKSFLQELNKSLLSLARYLERERIAHGDIQPGNVMVANEGRSIQLIDYDGMYVDDLKTLGSTEQGLRHFQHPGRGAAWDLRLDRFSFVLLNFAIRVLETHPDLWDETQSDENSILFKAEDFAEPGNSGIFRRLDADSQFRDDARNFASICKAPFDKIPTPDDFLVGRNIPQVAVTISPTGKIVRTGYLGAYPVLDATKYKLCMQYVGDRVELVGQIIDVTKRTTRYGGRPYIFINFGDWTEDIVKLNIWSEGLEALSDIPDKSWEGKWVSVVGLMEPPYYNPKYGYTHLAISITQDNQFHIISEQETKFRLSGSGATQAKAATPTGNREIFERMRDVSSSSSMPASTSQSPVPPAAPIRSRRQSTKSVSSTPSSSVPSRPTSIKSTPATQNQAVLNRMKTSQLAPPIPPRRTQPAKVKTQPSKQKRTPWFAWLFGAGAATLLCLIPLIAWLQPVPIVRTTPTHRPTATATRKPTQSVPIVPVTKKASCVSWTEINENLQGNVQCVYGIVASRKNFRNDEGEFSYTLIRFSGDPDTFYLTSHSEPLSAFAGDCVSAEAAISYDANGIPFMEVSEIARNKYSCSK